MGASSLEARDIIYPDEITNAPLQYVTLALGRSNSHQSSSRHVRHFLLISQKGIPLTIPTIFASFALSFKHHLEKNTKLHANFQEGSFTIENSYLP